MGQLKNALTDLKANSPLLIMASAVEDFLKVYKGPIKEVRDSEDVRELVSYYLSISSIGYPLVISDLSYLTSNATNLLLKKVEETNFPIVLLAKYDNVSPMLLSRMKTVVKYYNHQISSELLGVKEGLRTLDGLGQEIDYFDRLNEIVRKSPKIYYYDRALGYVKNKKKLMTFFN